MFFNFWGEKGAIDGVWGRGSHSAFHTWASEKYGNAYLTRAAEYKNRGKEFDVRRDSMFQTVWIENPVPTNTVPTSYSWSRGNRDKREIAITFDDGPHKTRTPQLLDILKKHNVVATFFVQGQYVNTPEGQSIVQRMVAEGHEVGHHSWDHPQLSRQEEAGLKHQIEATIAAIVKWACFCSLFFCWCVLFRATGKAPKTIRPPYGATNPVLNKRFLEQWGLRVVLWDVDPEDWKKGMTSQQIANAWATNAKNGSILLAHDIHQVTVDAMDSAVSQLKARGFTFKTADQLLNF